MILVVDDETSILSITSETLQAFGYEVLTASNGAEAVAIYAQQKDKIAMILTDLSMPVMDGRATIYALLKINPKAKIICDERHGRRRQRGQGLDRRHQAFHLEALYRDDLAEDVADRL